MKLLFVAIFIIALSGCHPNMAKERKANALYLLEADRIILACEKYKCAHGTYPAELKDLDSKIWTEARIDLRKERGVEMYYGSMDGLTLRIGSIQYDFSLWEPSKGWQETDKSF